MGEALETTRAEAENASAEAESARAEAEVAKAAEALQAILDDYKEFCGRLSWYAARGVPYRRGYLLTGKGDSGKTHFTKVYKTAHEAAVNLALLKRDRENDS